MQSLVLALALCAVTLDGVAGVKLANSTMSGRFSREVELESGTSANDLMRIGSSEGKCLNFLHIPRTMGFSIEMSGQHRDMGSHGPNLWGRFAGSMLCSKTAHRSDGQKSDCVIQHVSPEATCSKEHVPPSQDGKIAQYYSQCETFCVVRSPTERMLSEFTFQDRKCTEKNVKKFVKDHLASHKKAPYRDDCHFVSQSVYVYGEDKDIKERLVRPDHPHTYCTRILKYENLTAEFDSLMVEFGYPDVRLQRMNQYASDEEEHEHRCHLNELMRPLVDGLYGADLANFGYDA